VYRKSAAGVGAATVAAAGIGIVAAVAGVAPAAAAEDEYDKDDPDPAVVSISAKHNYVPFSALKKFSSRCAVGFQGSRDQFSALRFTFRHILCRRRKRCYSHLRKEVCDGRKQH